MLVPPQEGDPIIGLPVIDAIIPARDEASTVAGVVRACLACSLVREVIVVDDASADETVALAASAGANVVSSAGWVEAGGAGPCLSPDPGGTEPARRAAGPARRALLGMALRALAGGSGPVGGSGPAGRAGTSGSKAHAMATGAAVSDAEAFLFVDADLIGLTGEHLEAICRPFIEGVADMSVGWFDYGWWNPVVVRLPPTTGERVVPRWVFEAVPPWRRHGYNLEILMNEVIAEGRLHTAACTMGGVTHRTKRDKLGPREGRRQTWHMFWTLMGLPMTGVVRWRTYWFYWRGLILRPVAGGPVPSPTAAAPLVPRPGRPR